MNPKFPVFENRPDEAAPVLYLPDGSLYRGAHDPQVGVSAVSCKQKIVVTGEFPPAPSDRDVLVETVCDPENPERLAFLVWKNGKATVVPEIERAGKIFVPPDPSANSFPLLSLPEGLAQCGEPAEMLAEIASTISKFVKLLDEQLRIVASFVLATWFPDCLEAAPYLFIVGPFGSAKTKLLKLLRCFCRRGLIAGDIRSGSLYKLVDAWAPTLIIDEMELGNSVASAELLRLLRTGSVPGVPTFRNGQRFSTYGLKIIASRQPLGDAALSSRVLVISLLPTEEDTPPLDEEAIRQLESEFQAKLCMFRLKNHSAVKNFRIGPDALKGLSGRMRQVASALVASRLGDKEWTTELLKILGRYDEVVRIERSLEPEWLVAEACFEVCHEGMDGGYIVPEILVGGIACQVNRKLKRQGEDLALSSKKVGLVLNNLGLNTVKLGRMGRGLKLTPDMKRAVHALVRQLGVDRRSIATSHALEVGVTGTPCALCDEYGVTGGLRFVEKFPRPRSRPLPNRGLLRAVQEEYKDQDLCPKTV